MVSSFCTVAVKFCVRFTGTLGAVGDTATEMGGMVMLALALLVASVLEVAVSVMVPEVGTSGAS